MAPGHNVLVRAQSADDDERDGSYRTQTTTHGTASRAHRSGSSVVRKGGCCGLGCLFGRSNKILPEKEDRSGVVVGEVAAIIRVKPPATTSIEQQPPSVTPAAAAGANANTGTISAAVTPSFTTKTTPPVARDIPAPRLPIALVEITNSHQSNNAPSEGMASDSQTVLSLQDKLAAARREVDEARSELENYRDVAKLLSDFEEDEDLRSMIENFVESRQHQFQILPAHLQVYEDQILNLKTWNQEKIKEYLINVGVTPFQIRCMALRISIEQLCKRAGAPGSAVGEQIRRLRIPQNVTTIDGSRPGCEEIRRRIKKAYSICCDNMHWTEGRDYSGNFRLANGKDPAEVLREVEFLLGV